MRMEECLKQALEVCPPKLASAVERECRKPGVCVEELRLRVGAPAGIFSGGREWALTDEGRLLYADSELVCELISRATERSLYAVQDNIREGFCTLRGGHRLGVCGSVVRRGGEILSIREFSSVNLRIARQRKGAADALSREIWQSPGSTLIVGAPGSGKTTVLRDLIRQLSDRYRYRVSVIDERGELAACVDGVPQFEIGACTDVLSDCPKEEGIEMLLRSMRPDWIALDELSSRRDVEAICKASYCGVHFIATAHAWNREELQKRPVYRALFEADVFRSLAFLDSNRQVHCERI